MDSTRQNKIRFVIRDAFTKLPRIVNGIVIEFVNKSAAENYFKGMNFGMSDFYEIYDIKNCEVISK